MASFTMLRLRSTDVALVERQLRVKIAQLPSLFLDAPVLVDLGALGEGASSLALDDLVRAMRACKLVPVAAANIPDELRDAVAAAGLGVWRPPVTPRGRRPTRARRPRPPPAPETTRVAGGGRARRRRSAAGAPVTPDRWW